MTTAALPFLLAGALLVGLGLYGVLVRPVFLRKLLAANILGTGVFLLLVAPAHRSEGIDPLPHALVLTGIVVAASATGLALTLLRGLYAADRDNDEESH